MGCEYFGDKITNYVSEVRTYLGSSKYPNGGFEYSYLSEIMSRFFDGNTLTLVGTTSGALVDTFLSPGETAEFTDIFKTFDTRGADFEVGVPVGAILSDAACGAITRGTASTACRVLLSGFDVSLSASGPSIYIDSWVTNYGDHPTSPMIITSANMCK